jgi:Protein of unknown function (DUF2721)
MDTSSGFLALIGAAVTPVVMISACAILISGVGSRHTELSDRIRALAAEYRGTASETPRRAVLFSELRDFMCRSRLTWLAHCFLYLATADFAAAVLATLHALRRSEWGQPTLTLFIIGCVLLFVALLLMLCELLLAQRTLDREAADIVDREGGA